MAKDVYLKWFSWSDMAKMRNKEGRGRPNAQMHRDSVSLQKYYSKRLIS